MRVAVVGVTGMVGNVMLEVLAEHKFPVTELIPVASEKSVGKKITFQGTEYTVIGLQQAVSLKPDLALFSAGATVSKEWAPKFAQVGTTVVDNSSAWRMDDTKKLVIPEINADVLTKDDKIIANPNCSTIQMLVALAPLQKKYKGEKGEMAYHYPIHRNVIPHCDVFEDNGYTKEEMKLVRETKKILRDDSIAVTATAVRIPVVGGHSEAVNVELKKDFNIDEVRALLAQSPGIKVQDNTDTNTYPMPLYAHGKDDVFVGRIRRDESQPNTLNLWVVADNLRKGAATNTIQIAEYLIAHKLL